MNSDKLKELNDSFRSLEKKLAEYDMPDNLFNKFMSLLLSSTNFFELISTRYKNIRQKISDIHREDMIWINSHPDERVRPAHPDENYANAAIRVDVESLFMFGIILVRRTLPIIKIFIKDQPPTKTFEDVSNFYQWIMTEQNLDPLTLRLRDDLKNDFRWLNSVLRFYRNKFIEHLDIPQQQGMSFSLGGKEFSLHSYKWEFNFADEQKILNVKSRLEQRGIFLPKEFNPRHYVQLLFDYILFIPEDMLKDVWNLIEDVGIDSPKPADLINGINFYVSKLLLFIRNNLEKSGLEKFKKAALLRGQT